MDPSSLITTCRRGAGLTQRQLAERAGTSAAAVCLYESGQRVPRVDTLTRIIAATGASLVLGANPPPGIDLEANGRALEALLDLADHLPRRSAHAITAPVFASLAA